MPGRILIVDDVATNRIVMKVKLAAACYEVELASSGKEAIEIARRGGIDVIIMDMLMPGMSGAEATRHLRADPATSSIPVVLVTALEEPAVRLEGLEAGADDFLTRPVDEVALLARVRSLLRSREEERDFEERSGWLSVGVDGSGGVSTIPPTALPGFGIASRGPATPGLAEAPARFEGARPAALPAVNGRVSLVLAGREEGAVLAKALASSFRETPRVTDREGALGLTEGEAPDVLLIDADLDGPNQGLRLMSELRSRPTTRHSSCVVVLPPGDSERAATALDLGAADVVHRPLIARELAMRLRTQLARKERADRMRAALDRGLKMAVIDPLTGLHNRRYGLHQLERIATRCRAAEEPVGLVLMDIDHFKSVNDTHGHPVGDRVLTQVAQVMRDNTRLQDLVCRLGGEEFLAILPETSPAQVQAVAERLRKAIEAMDLRLSDGARLPVTMSLGVTMLEPREDAMSRALDRVDRALYGAKSGGRNRVVEIDGDMRSH
ncbi:diguanylate cyclase [Jannaschia aquimarina]|uniref:diguanylate cyclase n=1 Tax=Jannaschia aquimarina TaxID=935700 RepID=A0A0D1EGZ7_9RHOB|nr:diguanylate cyclase [Jannaschia aquimarina]KIT16919.1 Response regulator PleD [Jannaschia aquimarina]SNT11619.1 response regulator receiver modulated diguanylate cyclase [Jannaschia aquimarina]